MRWPVSAIVTGIVADGVLEPPPPDPDPERATAGRARRALRDRADLGDLAVRRCCRRGARRSPARRRPPRSAWSRRAGRSRPPGSRWSGGSDLPSPAAGLEPELRPGPSSTLHPPPTRRRLRNRALDRSAAAPRCPPAEPPTRRRTSPSAAQLGGLGLEQRGQRLQLGGAAAVRSSVWPLGPVGPVGPVGPIGPERLEVVRLTNSACGSPASCSSSQVPEPLDPEPLEPDPEPEPEPEPELAARRAEHRLDRGDQLRPGQEHDLPERDHAGLRLARAPPATARPRRSCPAARCH